MEKRIGEDKRAMILDDAKTIMVDRFRPTLAGFFHVTNASEFKKWQGNCCRQMAVIGCEILSRLLPEYEWEAWEGDFRDLIGGVPMSYAHAWIYGKSDKGGLFIDLARQHHPVVFNETDENVYPTEGYEYMFEVSRKQMDWKKMIEETEYYSSMPGKLIADLMWSMIRLHG